MNTQKLQSHIAITTILGGFSIQKAIEWHNIKVTKKSPSVYEQDKNISNETIKALALLMRCSNVCPLF
ncbi:hypothetical protein DERF_005725 [Dermatophagoides farinae]|uniref:Uncharacterized protein n=1 Tax=Dermatophagoides farinae TaxID=6954 RepID=A0A922I671_DERFA|nr:hypothetical protein DERF_005725 [Dermatophagoides farinae]